MSNLATRSPRLVAVRARVVELSRFLAVGGVSFVVGDRHLFSPDDTNVFWLDPDNELIKAIK